MFHLPRNIPHAVFIAVLLAMSATTAKAAESDAIAISSNIRQFHMPYGTLLDPVFASSDPNSADYLRIVGYARAGDSAIWTGHYLGAEAFRYSVTHSQEALANVWQSLRGIHSLLDVTGTDLLARCLIPTNSPYASAIKQAEAGHGIYYSTLNGTNYFWIGDTSRDQYSGVMFGFGAAYDLVDDSSVRDFIRKDVTRILNYLLRHSWNVAMPNDTISTTFLIRPDQQLSLLQVGRHVDPQTFGTVYASYRSSSSSLIYLPIAYDNLDDHNHYFKFNLNYINLYNLIRLEENGSPYKQTYLDAYSALRRRTQTHGNAQFNMVDRALTGPNSVRDTETSTILGLWLQRPRRDYWVDLRGVYPSCEQQDRACDPIPVNQRVNTDFLWQRSPFLLYGGGVGTIETAGIDYILPYWMARSFGL
jgi:hypothetical protein